MWTGFRLGSGDPVNRPTLGCHVSRRLSSRTLSGGSPSGYMVVGYKFRRFPCVCEPLNPCAFLWFIEGVFSPLLTCVSCPFMCDCKHGFLKSTVHQNLWKWLELILLFLVLVFIVPLSYTRVDAQVWFKSCQHPCTAGFYMCNILGKRHYTTTSFYRQTRVDINIKVLSHGWSV